MKLNIKNYYYYNNFSSNPDYNAPVLCIEGRDKDLNPHFVRILDKENLAPQFGILYEDYENINLTTFQEIVKVEEAPDSPYNEKTVRLYTTFPFEVGRLVRTKEGEEPLFQKTFYGDVKWEKMAMSKIIKILDLKGHYIDVPDDYAERFLKVKDLKAVDKKDFFLCLDHICYWDIEADGRGSEGVFSYDTHKLNPIVCLGGYDNYTDEYHSFVWRLEWSKIVEEHDNYKIVDNVDPTIVHTLRKLFIHKFNNEKETIIEYANFVGRNRFDEDFGFNSYGGIKVLSKKGKSYRQWFDGYDWQHLYERSKYLGLLEEIQVFSTCPMIPNKYNRYDGVYLRVSSNRGKQKHEVVTKGLGHIDFIYSNETLKFTNKFEQFRGAALKDYAEFFLKYHKLEKNGKHVWWYWENDIKFLIDYNLIDVKICVDLDKFFKVSEKQRNRIVIPIAPFEDALQASKLHDHYKLTHFQNQYSLDTKYQRGVPHRNISGKKYIGKKFKLTLEELERQAKRTNPEAHYENLYNIHKVGGLVITPAESGIYKNVIRGDFSKYYGRAIQALNIGIVSSVDVEKEYWFCVKDKSGKVYDRKDLIETPISYYRKDIESINKSLFDEWITNELKSSQKLKDYVREFKTTKTDEYKLLFDEVFNIKVFRNGAFGVLGLEIDRTHTKLGYNSTTCSCQDGMFFTLDELCEMAYKVIQNDSVVGERCVPIRYKGKTNIIPIEDLWKKLYNDSHYIKYKVPIEHGKEYIIIDDVDTLNEFGEWTPIKEIMRHNTNKRIFRVNQSIGETICTEDHSIITSNGEKTPLNIENSDMINLKSIEKRNNIYNDSIIDLYELLKGFTITKHLTYPNERDVILKWNTNGNSIWFGWKNESNQKSIKRYVSISDLSKLLGIYVADGHSSFSCNRITSGISSSSKEFLNEIKNIIEKINNNFKITIIKSSKRGKRILYGNEYEVSDMYRIQMNNNTFGALFHYLGGSGSENKKVPMFIFNTNESHQKEFLDYYLKGDGTNYTSIDNEINFTTKSLRLISGISYILTQFGREYSISYYNDRDVYLLQENLSGKRYGKIKVSEQKKEDRYVYDLSVKGNKFIDCCGMVLLHNTDSALWLANSSDVRDCEEEGKQVCGKITENIRKYFTKTYNTDDAHLLKFDLETIFDKFYVDAKKHYVGRAVYQNGTWLDKPELEVKGMDLKKRATSKLGADNQINLINAMFDYEDPIDGIKKYIRETDEKLSEMEWDYCCKRGPLKKELEKYPASNQSATAARNMEKYFGKRFEPGSNPYLGVFNKFPPEVNGIRIEERDHLVLSFDSEDIQMLKKLGFKLNIEKIRETECRAKTNHILGLFNTNWDECLTQSELGGFMML